MRRRTLYVHVGPMKTGTTAVQTILRENAASPLIYPKKFLSAGAHHPLVFSFFGDRRPQRPGATDVREQFEEIRSLAQDNDRDMLISSEALVPMGWQPRRVDVGELIRAILPCFGGYVPNVEILVACREHFSWAASTYNQRLKANERRDPDAFLRAYCDTLCFAPIIRNLEKTGFRVTAINYHPSQSWVERFLTHVGFPAQMLPRANSNNVSLNPAGLIMKLAVNRAFGGEEISRKVRRELRNRPEFAAPSQFIFGKGAARRAERAFSEDRRILAGTFAIELPLPDLNSPNMFFVDARDLAMIESLARKLGLDDEAVGREARQFLRDGVA